ncbi:MAG: RNA-binding S4 domain-containing protein [Bacteroidales bacterium]|nr:RNA-binding S4 domain-containing protein [Bacteroidales bacterium]
MADSVRVDKYIWAIRLFKTRSEATDACKGNKVKVGGQPAKPSREVKSGDTIEVRKGAVVMTYKVKAILENRVGAKLVPEYAENLTPEDELAKMHAPGETFFVRRDRGAGRPTKKERREMDSLWESISFDDEDE